MIPILYPPKTTDFSNFGLGLMTDTLSYIVAEERNGIYELSLQYPDSGRLFHQIQPDCYIKAKPNLFDKDQIFLVHKITAPTDGVIQVEGEHISYALSDNLVLPGFTASGNAALVMEKLFSSAVLLHPFTAWSDIDRVETMTTDEPASPRAWMMGREGSILDLFGGEYAFDNFDVKLYAHRGRDTGVVIQYGKNLINAEQESSLEGMYTAIYPYAKYTPDTEEGDGEEILVELPEKILKCEDFEKYGHGRVYSWDASEKFGDEVPTPERLREFAQNYMELNDFGKPHINIKASFLQLWQSTDYQDRAVLEQVRLCDLVTVRFPRLGIDAKAKVIRTEFNGLTEQYESIELGDAKGNFADTVTGSTDISDQVEEVVRQQSGWFTKRMQQAIKEATEAITGQTGGCIVLNPENHPREILIMDTDDKNTAKNVWRWNLAGLGHSSTGINGPYGLAITADGKIVADYILTGKLEGALLKAGSVSAEALSVEFKQSIEDEITGVVKTVTQLFTAADGKLKSEIEEKIENSIGELEKQVSSLVQTSKDFTFYFEMIGVDGETRKGKTQISLDGLTVYDGAIKILSGGRQVFYAMPDGTLMLDGRVYADAGSHIGSFVLNQNILGGENGGVGINTYSSQHDGVGFFCGGNWSNIANAPIRLYHTGSAAFGKNVVIGGNLVEAYNAAIKCSSLQVAGTTIQGEQYGEYWLAVHQHLYVYGAGWFTGKVTAAGWGETSDARMKHNIEDSETDGLSVIKKIRHRKYTWNKDTPQAELSNGLASPDVSCGYIAQELEEINPELVQKPITPSGDDVLYQVNFAYLHAMETRAIQQLAQRIENLEEELKELRGKLNGNN
ncbi:MAG: phage tail spike protein [Massiliimalia sp.]